VEIGLGEQKEFRLSRPQVGHLKDLKSARYMRSFEIATDKEITRGDLITVSAFAVGEMVKVAGNTKGHGFAGVVKRHDFAGGPASHGHKDNLRAPGAIGAGGVQRVFKDLRMAGRMGGEQVSVSNLEIVEIHPETNEIYIKGAVPGAKGGLLLITAEGELKVEKQVSAETAPTASTTIEEKSVPATPVENAPVSA